MDYYITGKLTRSEEIYNMMLQNIINGVWTVDEKIPSENQLCKIYNTSRASIRMAITMLQSKGFLHTRQGIGSYVCIPAGYHEFIKYSNASPPQVDEQHRLFIEFRQAVEGKAFELFVLRADKEDYEEMRNAVENMKIHFDDGVKFNADDLNFHNAIYRGSKNNFIINSMQMNMAVMRSYFEKINLFMTPEQRKDVSLRHEAIYMDLCNGKVRSSKERLNHEIVQYYHNMHQFALPEHSEEDEEKTK